MCWDKDSLIKVIQCTVAYKGAKEAKPVKDNQQMEKGSNQASSQQSRRPTPQTTHRRKAPWNWTSSLIILYGIDYSSADSTDCLIWSLPAESGQLQTVLSQIATCLRVHAFYRMMLRKAVDSNSFGALNESVLDPNCWVDRPMPLGIKMKYLFCPSLVVWSSGLLYMHSTLLSSFYAFKVPLLPSFIA